MHRLFFTAAIVAGLTCHAAAQSRPDSLSITCAQARDLVARNGGIVIGTGPHIYERFVADARFCPAGDAVRPTTIPTRDTPVCQIGGICFTPQGVMRWDD